MLSKLLILSLLYHSVRCQKVQKEAKFMTVAPTQTVTIDEEEAILDKKELSDEELERIMNLEKGKFSTISFKFYNDQNTRMPSDVTKFKDKCIDHYLACTMGQLMPMPVCAFNNKEHFYDALSYCDVHYDNCIRGVVAWQIVAPGGCKFEGKLTTAIPEDKGHY